MSDQIGIVVPRYNATAFLREAIDLARVLTQPAQEIIMVDEASMNGSLGIA